MKTYWLLMLLYPLEPERGYAIVKSGKNIDSEKQSMIVGVYATREACMKMWKRETRRITKRGVSYLVSEAPARVIDQLREAGVLEGDPPRLVMDDE